MVAAHPIRTNSDIALGKTVSKKGGIQPEEKTRAPAMKKEGREGRKRKHLEPPNGEAASKRGGGGVVGEGEPMQGKKNHSLKGGGKSGLGKPCRGSRLEGEKKAKHIPFASTTLRVLNIDVCDRAFRKKGGEKNSRLQERKGPLSALGGDKWCSLRYMGLASPLAALGHVRQAYSFRV